METLGIERSYQAMADSDLTLVVVDLSADVDSEDRILMDKAASQGHFLVVGNKRDLPRKAAVEGAVEVSALTGEGIEGLREQILASIAPSGAVEQESGSCR